MPTYTIDLRRPEKVIGPIPLIQGGVHPNGDEISFTNYYLQRNGRPLFGVCGEFHYSRYPASEWEDELIRMKLGGVNVVATYVFWIHHEEEEGCFRWEGDRDLRRFIELCGRHGLLAIVRVGPFAHGEVRNGGFPDWLYGRPVRLRSNDPAYLRYTARLYGEIGRQLRGLFYQDGGPIVAVQLENEFMHASAPWEVVPRQAREWVPGGEGGEAHMRALKELALANGLVAPFYTSTGWGGAPVLAGEALPLYGGYAFCPWNVDEQRPEHAPTAEYLFRSYHENGASWGGAEPPYPPESYPFACCEMGGGMQVWYQHRFVVPPESVAAMALMKIAGGCNFVGYYMYHGGSNPVGRRAFLNEHVTPRISYDFQAPLGEYGQVRDSYRALRLIHQFASDFADELCPTATVLPPGSAAITPTTTETLRFAARSHRGAGFLFLNNYQDHVAMQNLHDLRIEVQTADETVALPRRGGLTLRRDACAILPINLDLGGARLRYATAQLVTRLEHAGGLLVVFFAPDGMASEYSFAAGDVAELEVESGASEQDGDLLAVSVTPGTGAVIRLRTRAGRAVQVLTLTRAQALGLAKLELWGRERLVLSDADLLVRGELLELQRDGGAAMSLSLFPAVDGELCAADGPLAPEADELFTRYRLSLPGRELRLQVTRFSDAAVSVAVPAGSFDGLADIMLAVRYRGDVGHASIAGELVGDDFANGEPWVIGLRRFERRLAGHALDLYVSPLREGRVVFSDSAMAIQQTLIGQQVAHIKSVEATPRYRAWVAHRAGAHGRETA